MPATTKIPKPNDNFYIFISNKKYSLAYSDEIKSLESVIGTAKKSFVFYFIGKSKNETQSHLILIATTLATQGRIPKLLGYTDGSILPNTLNKNIKIWNEMIREKTNTIKADKMKKETADKEKKK